MLGEDCSQACSLWISHNASLAQVGNYADKHQMNVCLYFIIAHGAFQGHATNLIDQSHFNDESTTVIFYNCC